MGLDWIRYHEAVCDICHHSERYNFLLSINHLKKIVRKKGWMVRKNGMVLCPSCKSIYTNNRQSPKTDMEVVD